jgi:hypothetical protein
MQICSIIGGSFWVCKTSTPGSNPGGASNFFQYVTDTLIVERVMLTRVNSAM